MGNLRPLFDGQGIKDSQSLENAHARGQLSRILRQSLPPGTRMRSGEWERARSVSQTLEDKNAAMLDIEVTAQFRAAGEVAVTDPPAPFGGGRGPGPPSSGVWSASSDRVVVLGWVGPRHLIDLAGLGCSRFGRKELFCGGLRIP